MDASKQGKESYYDRKLFLIVFLTLVYIDLGGSITLQMSAGRVNAKVPMSGPTERDTENHHRPEPLFVRINPHFCNSLGQGKVHFVSVCAHVSQ